MKTWLKEPLLHFLFAGVLLFAAYEWLNRDTGDDATAERVVHVTTAQVEWLKESWARQRQRVPDEEELKGLVASYLKEELLAREAKELGLEENDTVVRRRLAQKLEFLVQDTARLAEPTEEDLRRFYEAHPERFQTGAHISFTHVFFSRELRQDAAADVRTALAELSSADAVPDNLGDRLLLEAEFHQVDKPTVASQFGPDFADAVMALEPGAWTGPLESGYGLHLVHVSELTPAARWEFVEVKTQVIERWREEQEREAHAQYFAGLLKKYDVIVDESVGPLVGQLAEAMR
jgi:hypothetical protein